MPREPALGEGRAARKARTVGCDWGQRGKQQPRWEALRGKLAQELKQRARRQIHQQAFSHQHRR